MATGYPTPSMCLLHTKIEDMVVAHAENAEWYHSRWLWRALGIGEGRGERGAALYLYMYIKWNEREGEGRRVGVGAYPVNVYEWVYKNKNIYPRSLLAAILYTV